MDSFALAGLAIWYMAFLFSVSLHEASHAFAAARGGDYTAYAGGQVTLNPVPHMMREKFGMIVVPLLSYFLNGGSWMIGWASAPFNPLWAARYPRRALLMSLAGPFSHILPAAAAWIVMFAGLKAGVFVPHGVAFAEGYLVAPAAESGFAVPLALFASVLLRLNILLLVFNLIPLPPMDGSEIWFQFVKYEEPRLRLRAFMHTWSLVGLILAWKVFPPLYWAAMNITVSGMYRLAFP